MINELAFTREESKTTFVLVLTFSLRLMGLFMLFPIFSVRVGNYVGANETLIGVAAGIYGFPQAMLQLPFGYLSDKLGRKTILLLGFLILVIGSVICALAQDIYMLILGRALQGAGAIGSVVTAAIADNTREIIRTRAMAFFGMSIGLAFMLSIPLGPLLDGWVGISGIFWGTAAVALISMLLCALFLPSEQKPRNAVITGQQFWQVIGERKLLFFSAGILLLHAILTSFFLVVPNFIEELGISSSLQSYMYLGVVFLAMLLSYRTLYFADRHNNMFKLNSLGVFYLAISLPLAYIARGNFLLLSIFLLMFFMAFCVLESSIPALVSKCVAAEHRGLALGFFSSAQFFGIFLGGLIGGWLNGKFGMAAVIYFATGLAFVWLIMAGCFREN
jgi:predicted MFS family arabinose efflux permease